VFDFFFSESRGDDATGSCMFAGLPVCPCPSDLRERACPYAESQATNLEMVQRNYMLTKLLCSRVWFWLTFHSQAFHLVLCTSP
jgi:hypothetical protein